MRVKHIIVDPDEQSRSQLKNSLDSYGFLDFLGSFTTYESASNSIRGEPPDIAFIKLGKVELNAYGLAGVIREQNPFAKVVFIRSREDYAIDAFECEADGFLLFPFDEDKIKNTLLRVLRKNEVEQRRTGDRTKTEVRLFDL